MSKNYSGSPLSNFYKEKDEWSFYVPPIEPCKYHKVLFQFPISTGFTPQPHVERNAKHWDDDHVRMPYSRRNLYPVEENGTKGVLISRWELISRELTKPIKSFPDLEKAIISYNRSILKLPALENFFENVLSEEESEEFFANILPKIIQLALSLPDILPGSIPLLKKHRNKSVSLSQLQVSSLLANAFLCTFPWKQEVSETYPGVNFTRLYLSCHRPRHNNSVYEKIKCILHYFQRITKNEPKGVVTFERRFLQRKDIPRWDKQQNNLGNTRVHIASTGTIEDDGFGFLQIDFANKYVGGGVLGYGCVQEEIRFVICPELLISRLFVEQLDDTEAVIVRGVERFSKYKGYGESFKWDGNYVDETPFDNYFRRKTTISIIDATHFGRADQQYNPTAIIRELNKAYVGFSSHHTDNLAPVATGNWGCGAFNGDVKLKMLIQLMACNVAHRDLVYFTFGDKELEETLYSMYLFIANNGIKTEDLWRMFCRFAASKLPTDQFYSFIQQCWFDMKDDNKLSLNDSLSKQCRKEENQSFVSSKRETSPVQSPLQKLKKDNTNTPTTSKLHSNFDDDEDIIPSSQPEKQNISPIKNSKQENSTISSSFSQVQSGSKSSSVNLKSFCSITTNKPKEKTKFDKELFKKSHDELLNIFSMIDGPPIGCESNTEASDTLLSAADKWQKEESKAKAEDFVIDIENSMDIEGQDQEPERVETKNKITDYFTKLGKR